jgi:hypothetical protein
MPANAPTTITTMITVGKATKQKFANLRDFARRRRRHDGQGCRSLLT